MNHTLLVFALVLGGLLTSAVLQAATGGNPPPTSGAAAQFGSITGRVTEGGSGNALQGAEVRIVGTSYEAYTDSTGEFRFPRLPPGEYQLRAAYLGVTPGTIRTVVSAGAAVSADIQLASEVLLMDRFQVSSQLEGEARAINRQRASNTITTVIASDDAGNLPDRSIEDLLGRVAGVSMSGGGGVTIRGAAPELNSVMLDGERMSSSSEGGGGRASHLSDVTGRPEGREVSVDNVDADLISSVEVVRALPANMDADGIGGTVNVVTRSALDLRRRIFRGRFEYNDNHYGGGGYGAALTYGDVVGRKWGYILNLSHSRDETASERNQPTYAFAPFDFPIVTGIDLRYEQSDRKRTGFNTTIDYQLSDATRLYLKTFVNLTRTHIDNYRTSVPAFTSPNSATATPTFVESLPVQLRVNNAANRRSNGVNLIPATYDREGDYYRIAAGGRTDLKGNRFDYEGNFDHSTAGLDGIRVSSRTPVMNPLDPTRLDRQIGWQVDRSETLFPRYTLINPYDPGTDPLLASDFRVVDLIELYHTPKSKTFEQGYNARLDWQMPREVRGLPVTFHGGLKYRGKYRTAGAQLRRLLVNQAAIPGVPANQRPVDGLFLQGGFTPPAMADGRYPTIGRFVNPALVRDYYFDVVAAQTPAQTAPTGNGLIREQFQADIWNWEKRNYSASEDIYAGYFMTTVDAGRLRLMPGVRVEHTTNGYKGKSFNQALTRRETITSRSDYTDFFPGVVATYRWNDNNVIRAGITRTIARPNYGDKAPYQLLPDNLSDPTAEVEIGNPDLKAQHSVNYDLAYERYFQPVGLFTVALFNKEIRNFIYTSTNYEDVTVNVAQPGQPPDFVTVTRTRTMERNGAEARLRGIEVSWQHQLKFLPSPLDGFGFNVNYTFVQGRSTIPDDLTGELITTDQLSKQAEKVYNAQLFYEKYRFRARVAVRHNSGWTQAVGNLGNTVIAPTTFWDASLQYLLTRNFTLFAEGRNLSKEITIRYLRSIDTPTWQTQNWGYRGGVRFNF